MYLGSGANKGMLDMENNCFFLKCVKVNRNMMCSVLEKLYRHDAGM